MKKIILGLVALVILISGYLIYKNNNQIEPIINNNETSYDNQRNGKICTQEVKLCVNGTFVGRTGPNCKFAKCPESKPKLDFIPIKSNTIELPTNVIKEKDCAAKGGEVFNTLGETNYDGELIGKIEGLNCPCACLIKDKK